MALTGFFCLPPYAAACFEPTSVELHQTGTFEGHHTVLATAPRLEWYLEEQPLPSLKLLRWDWATWFFSRCFCFSRQKKMSKIYNGLKVFVERQHFGQNYSIKKLPFFQKAAFIKKILLLNATFFLTVFAISTTEIFPFFAENILLKTITFLLR